MKPARRSPGAASQDRLDRLRRDRAAARQLGVAYPSLRQLRLELRFEGVGQVPVTQVHELHPPARAFFSYPCPYADCDGNFDLATVAGKALDHPAQTVSGDVTCAGVRARDRNARQPCHLQLHYTITAA